jgi:hypothetical protein
MPRRRSSGIRTLLNLVAVAGLVIAGVSGFRALQTWLRSDDAVLVVESAAATETPSTVPPDESGSAEPTELVIGDLDLDGAVRPVGLEDDGSLEIPDETEIGWYRYGSVPGRAGSTVLAAHVSWNGSLGPFHDLGRLEPGATVDILLDDGSTRTYEVVERTMYHKDQLPTERIWRTAGDETLVLITCGGDFNPEIHRYRHNIVVYAVPVADDGAAA